MRSLSILLNLSFSLSVATSFTIKTGPPTIPPPAAIQRAGNTSTGNPGQCSGGTKFFPQPIDHATFNSDWTDPHQTFLMQYEVNDTYYKPGGPILFYQGAETSAISCSEFQYLPTWAKELNALIVTNEHRYFGISTPYGLNFTEYATWDTAVMKPLTLDNVLRDGISLITHIKNQAFPSAKNAKVIMIGGTSPS